MKTIDLRSDTVTRPSPEMRQAMAQAEVGDDVFGDDPTVLALQRKLASLLGKQAALFVPSGTMSNQIAIAAQTQPGDDLLCESTAHIFVYEAGGPARLSGVTCRTLAGRRGILDVEDFHGLVHIDDQHLTRTRMICLENTHNCGGGAIVPLENVARICAFGRENGLVTHLDGARLFNAVVATGIPAKEWCQHFDTVSVCFSKGLGAPVGSALAGSYDVIARAHRVRKLLGGGMRQAGVLAAACIYALDHHIERLAEDHANAQILAAAIADCPGLSAIHGKVETNLIWVDVDPALGTAPDLVEYFHKHGILITALAPYRIRFCTHLDVDRADAEFTASKIRELAKGR